MKILECRLNGYLVWAAATYPHPRGRRLFVWLRNRHWSVPLPSLWPLVWTVLIAEVVILIGGGATWRSMWSVF